MLLNVSSHAQLKLNAMWTRMAINMKMNHKNPNHKHNRSTGSKKKITTAEALQCNSLLFTVAQTHEAQCKVYIERSSVAKSGKRVRELVLEIDCDGAWRSICVHASAMYLINSHYKYYRIALHCRVSTAKSSTLNSFFFTLSFSLLPTNLLQFNLLFVGSPSSHFAWLIRVPSDFFIRSCCSFVQPMKANERKKQQI